MLIITNHAIRRAKERMGLNKAALSRIAHKVYQKYKDYYEPTTLDKYLLHATNRQSKSPSDISLLHSQHVFVYREIEGIIKLLTILPLPNKLKKHHYGK